jgi:hypothetical protein
MQTEKQIEIDNQLRIWHLEDKVRNHKGLIEVSQKVIAECEKEIAEIKKSK